MIAKRFLTTCMLAWSLHATAQTEVQKKPIAPAQPFLFLTNTLTASHPAKTITYSGSMGQRAEGPFGYDGFNQQAGLSAFLGHKLTFIGTVALGFSNQGSTQTAQQAELIRNFIGGTNVKGLAVGLGLGLSRDWDNVKSALSRVTLAYNTAAIRLSGNMLFEKPFSSGRDKVDFTTSLGFQHRLKGNFFAGIETIGEDLEGFWEEDEAEGGAKMLIGPSINIKPSNSRFSFSACGGPVFFATRSTATASGAIREIGQSAQNGYSIRAGVNFSLH